MQPDRLDLHRHLLGPEIRAGEDCAGKPGKSAGRTPAPNRKVVRISEVRRRLALHDIRAAADRTWGRDARPMMRLGYRIQEFLRIPSCDQFRIIMPCCSAARTHDTFRLAKT